jgi:hypothetical protein
VQNGYWFEYYRHYSREATTVYNNTVVIKADDDVIYWDVDAFENFIRRRIAHPEVGGRVMEALIMLGSSCAKLFVVPTVHGYLSRHHQQRRRSTLHAEVWSNPRGYIPIR